MALAENGFGASSELANCTVTSDKNQESEKPRKNTGF